MPLPNGTEVLESRVSMLKGGNEDALVRAAMANPIGSEPLWKLAVGKRRAVVIISDHTRPVPSKHILPFMLEELRQENPEIQITLLVATGFHRGSTPAELEEKLGADLLRENIVIHDCRDTGNNVEIGVLPSGAPLVIDRLAAEADLLVSEGFIEPHFFAGYSGGRKSVLPGICGEKTVLGNHCAAFIDSPKARTGVLEGNPLHRDMKAAAQLAGLRYIVNVVIDETKRVAAAFAGEPLQAHGAGCALLAQYCAVKPARPGDIVVTTNGGHPLDQNVYQCVKGLTAAESAAAPGAVLVMCAACGDGAGGEGFYRALRDCASPGELLAQIRRVPMEQTAPDQWEAQILARILEKHKVIFVSDPSAQSVLMDMKLEYAPDLPTALAMARAEKGESEKLTVIPNGVSVVITL